MLFHSSLLRSVRSHLADTQNQEKRYNIYMRTVSSKNPTIFNIIRWVAETNDSSTKRLMFQVLLFFHNFFQNSFQKSFQFIFLNKNLKKVLSALRNYEKKIMLGTSDSWSMSRSSHRPSEPAYYIVDCRILSACCQS